MRIRTGHGPDDWTLNVPSHAYTGHHTGSLVVGSSGTSLKAKRQDRSTANIEAAFRRRLGAAPVEIPVRQVCGADMPYAKDTCARAPGHNGGHSTRWAMDNRAVARRAA